MVSFSMDVTLNTLPIYLILMAESVCAVRWKTMTGVYIM